MATTRFKRTKKALLAFIITIVVINAYSYITRDTFIVPKNMTLEEKIKQKMHHRGDGTFRNPWLTDSRKGFFDFLKWQFSKNAFEEERKKPFNLSTVATDFDTLEKTGSDYAVWLGHSTVLIKAGGKRIITDPVFFDVTFFIKRKAPFPVELDKLPKIDYVLISHGHYDHLSTKSIEYLIRRDNPVFVTANGYKKYFEKRGTSKNTVIDWFESFSSSGVKITALPSQHWSKRTLTDNNRMQWACFLIEANGKKIFWIGDSGYYEGYKELGEKFGPVDVLFAPIGAYEPRWFMQPYHMNPEEAHEVTKELKAKILIPIHWGTFDLTDEPLFAPPERIKAAFQSNNPGPENLKLLTPGEPFIIK
ncbi:MAG: MBL fold metallo-hydrolase [Deltaproteobacteria bacterium]|nr:MBL fold metallo-hydrolase [Deltaproteobacteria bacterium]